MELLSKHLEYTDGGLKLKGMYASIHVDIAHKGSITSVPYSHLVWFANKGAWPKEGYHLDHIDDDPLNNHIDNLQELTHTENQEKRRNRTVSRSFGTGKYGYGLSIQHAKDEHFYYVMQHISRGHHKESGRTLKRMIGRFESIGDAEAQIPFFIEMIKERPGELLDSPAIIAKRVSIELMKNVQHMRALRSEGRTYEEIARLTGFSVSSVYEKTRGMHMGAKLSNVGHRNIDYHQGAYRVRINRGGELVHYSHHSSLEQAITARNQWLLTEAGNLE